MPKHNKPWQEPWWVERSIDNNPLRNGSAIGLESIVDYSPTNGSFLQRAVARYGLPVLAALYLAACTPATPTPTITPETRPAATATPRPTQTPYNTPTAAPMPNNSYDFGKSLGLEADYLNSLNFDNNAKGFISYLASLPVQMRSIAERSGLVDKLIADKQVNADEQAYFKKIVESYRKDIEMMKPWLTGQLPDEQVNAALALNLANAIKYNQFASLPNALFTADGIKRMYAAEIKFGDKWGRAVLPYASAMVGNVTNFEIIRAKALEVANNPDAKYGGFSIEDKLSPEYFKKEAVGSNDKGLNAYEDITLLLKEGSPEAKATLRIYARNMTREGRQGSAEQVRVELTNIDAWSIGIPSYEVMIVGHDVPAIKVTDDDIALLKKRSSEPLLIVDISNGHYLPLQWTRKSILRKDADIITIYTGIGAADTKISDLKPY